MKKNKDFIKLMFISGGVGLLIFVLVAIGVAAMVSNKDKDKNTDIKKPTVEEKKKDILDADASYKRVTAVIKYIDAEGSSIIIADVETDESIDLKIKSQIQIIDKYGRDIDVTELKIGEIVNIKYNELNGEVETLRISAESFEYTGLENTIINEETKTIKNANDIYLYTDEIVILYNNSPIPISEITKDDTLTIKGFKNKIYTIIMEKSHGYIKLKNYDGFVGGYIDIDRDESVTIIQEMQPIPISNGSHKIVIEKEGYEVFIRELEVGKRETIELDLGAAEIKQGNVEFRANVDDYELLINGQVQNSLEERKLDYGEYEILARKSGQLDFKTTIRVDKDQIIVNIKFDEKPKFINITTSPDQVQVYIDDNFAGYSPISAPTKIGEHIVMLVKENYLSKKYTIRITDDNMDAYFNFPALERKDENPKEENLDIDSGNDNSSSNDNTISNDENSKKDTEGNNTPIKDVYGN